MITDVSLDSKSHDSMFLQNISNHYHFIRWDRQRFYWKSNVRIRGLMQLVVQCLLGHLRMWKK